MPTHAKTTLFIVAATNKVQSESYMCEMALLKMSWHPPRNKPSILELRLVESCMRVPVARGVLR